MSATYHTAYPAQFAVTSANLESPHSELDQAITNIVAGDVSVTQLNLGSFTSKTISSGAITGDKSLVTVDTESSAATDDLDTISSPASGDIMYIKIANASRVVTIRNNGGGTGNIRTYNGANVILNAVNQVSTLVYNGSNWIVLPNLINLLALATQTATIASGVIAYTSSKMTIDTESAAASDNLDTISGGVDGSVLFIKTANSGRDVYLRNTGNIVTVTGSNFLITNSTEYVMLIYDSTDSKWYQHYSPVLFTDNIGTADLAASSFQITPNVVITTPYHPQGTLVKPYIDVAPHGGLRQVRVLSATDTTLDGYGFGTLTVSGTPSNNFAGGDVNTGSLVRWASGGSSGNLGGVISPFLLTCLNNFPYFRIVFGTYASIATCRFWVGLSSAAIGNTDSPSSAGTSFIGIRYSTVASDASWKFVTSDGSTTNVTDSTITLAANTLYDLVIGVDGTGAVTMYLKKMIDLSYQTISATITNIPAGTTPLGLNARVETREAVAKSFQISGVALSH